MRVSKKAYVVNSEIAFMPHPHLRGLWLRVHPCILFVPCECGAKAQKPCRGSEGGEISGTHWYRRKDYQEWKKKRKEKVEFEVVIRKIA